MTDHDLAAIKTLLERHGAESYGEDITQVAHAEQAAHLALCAGEADAMIVAALLHDIGQFIDEAGHAAERHGRDAAHEHAGADFLARWFGPGVTEPVRLHVAAKRYLCAAEPGYAEGLSGASRLSLALQGGPMDAAECAAFAAGPHFAAALRLRRYDDEAKRPGWVVPGLATHHARMLSLIEREKPAGG